jgi:hypothetical protein
LSRALAEVFTNNFTDTVADMEPRSGGQHDKPIPITPSADRQRRVPKARVDVFPDRSGASEANAGLAGALRQDCPAVMFSSSSCGEGEGGATKQARPSQAICRECEEVLQELSGVITGVMINAQLLGWKLPPYSHLKRPVHEIERSVHRGAELLRRLLQRCNRGN